ncbi:MAG TPA: hypothetical protein DEA08_28070, partial [Planctomycetes bacterium]|nr:hypothetical protein [Planctomycetota bacterium]
RAWAEALAPGDEALRRAAEGLLAQRVAGARALLPQLLGEAASGSGWAGLLARRRSELGPQLLPAGWTSATRPALG